jgi:glycosyltransferase involved in cell wall biosynthesis
MICIPAFNEAKEIGQIIKRAKPYANAIIVCDDGSSDGTSEAARSAGATVVAHPANRGYGAAIKTLFEYAKEHDAEVMITLDSDGQHDPSQIPALLGPILRKEADMVIGSRFLKAADKKKVPAYRSLGIKTITKLAQLTSKNHLTDAQSGFRAYNKKAIASIDLTEDGMAASTEILMRAGQRNLTIKEVPITIRYDIGDTSTHNPLSHGGGIVLAILRFLSIYHPLSFYGLPGIGFLSVAGYFAVQALDIFSATRYVSTPMIIISVGTAVIGSMLLVTAIILYSLSALIRERIRI